MRSRAATHSAGRRSLRRYGFACQGCKARKIKCNGEQPCCAACARSETECVWPSSSLNNHRSERLEKQLQDASSRIRRLESALGDTQAHGHAQLGQDGPGLGPPGLDPSPGPRNDISVGSENNNQCPAGAMMAVDAATSSPSVAGSHAYTTTATTARDASIWSQVGVGEDGAIIYNGPTSRFHAGPLDENQPASTSPLDDARRDQQARASQAESLRSQYDLLDSVWVPLGKTKNMEAFGISKEMGSHLLEMYWSWLHPLHNCVYRPVFLMDMALNGPYYSDFLLTCIFALSARHLSRQQGDDESNGAAAIGDRMFRRAKALLLEEMDRPKPRIPTIQGLLILGGRECAMGKSSQGWLFTGMAIRMMVDIGVHLHTSKIAELERLTPAEIETRKRLYNSAYIWDKTLSLALGRSPSLVSPPYGPDEILDQFDNEQEWPSEGARDIASLYSPVPMCNTATFSGFCELHRITTDMMLLLHTRGLSDNLQPEIDNMSLRLCEWHDQLSAALKVDVDEVSSTRQCPPPHIASLNFLYHALHILLRRPLLHSPDAATRARAMAACAAHSQRIHAIHELYARSFPHRLMTYQVSYCIYTAATVDAYETRHAEPRAPGRLDAARRLGRAVRTLQDEAEHTPGSGRSLDTIRRQLSA
ncbi:fungal-specific transcription factor domain-containing protein, partial [Microdochium trichocladiopsis]